MEKRKMKADFVHLAQKIIVDRDTGNVSLINLIDIFQTVSVPSVLHEFAIILRTEPETGDPEEVEVELVVQQDENELFRSKFKAFYKEGRPNNLIINIRGLLIKKISPVKFIFKRDGNNLIEKLISVLPIIKAQ